MLHEPGLMQIPMTRIPITVSLDWRDRVYADLDPVLDALAPGGLAGLADSLSARLDRMRAEATAADWVDKILPWVRAHPAIAIVRARLPVPVTPPASAAQNRAARTRNLTIANLIDAAAARVAAPHILALGCSRLSELDWSLAVTERRIGGFIVAGRDLSGLRRIADNRGDRLPALQAMGLSVRDVLRGAASRLGPFDAIYAADLALPPPPATLASLTAKLFARLNPGGQLILGALGEAGGSSALADAMAPALPLWRSAAAVTALTADIPRTAILSQAVLATPAGQGWYLDLRRI